MVAGREFIAETWDRGEAGRAKSHGFPPAWR